MSKKKPKIKVGDIAWYANPARPLSACAVCQVLAIYKLAVELRVISDTGAWVSGATIQRPLEYCRRISAFKDKMKALP